MALDEQAQEANAAALSEEEELDLSILVNLAKELIDDGGFDVVQQAVDQSNDPGQVVGQFLMQMGAQLVEQMPEDVTMSPRVLLAEGGWVEQISDYLQEQYDISKEVMDRAEIYVGTSAQELASGQQQQQAAAPQQAPAAPVLPAGGV